MICVAWLVIIIKKQKNERRKKLSPDAFRDKNKLIKNK